MRKEDAENEENMFCLLEPPAMSPCVFRTATETTSTSPVHLFYSKKQMSVTSIKQPGYCINITFFSSFFFTNQNTAELSTHLFISSRFSSSKCLILESSYLLGPGLSLLQVSLEACQLK